MSKHRIAWMLLLSCLISQALGEEDLEISIVDIVADFDQASVGYVDELWDFPVPLTEMDPIMIRLANKYMLLSKDDKPVPIVTVKTRKANKDGSNANGGVNKASESKMELQETCYLALVDMFEAALQDGIKLYLKSAYRSWQTQRTMYYNRLEKNKGKDDGWVSKPGASDHQTGLGCDIVSRSWRDKAMNSKFAETAEAKWMAEHCHEFGFILRYPEDKQEITEINFEPWHFRYVGIPAATYIMQNGLSLEEFHEQLNQAIQLYIEYGGEPSVVEPYQQISAEDE